MIRNLKIICCRFFQSYTTENNMSPNFEKVKIESPCHQAEVIHRVIGSHKPKIVPIIKNKILKG